MPEPPIWVPLRDACTAFVGDDTLRAYHEALELARAAGATGWLVRQLGDGATDREREAAARQYSLGKRWQQAERELASDLWRRLLSGELVARARPGFAHAEHVALPADAWLVLLPLDWRAGTVRDSQKNLYFAVEIARAAVPTSGAGRNRSEQEKSNDFNDVPTVPTVPTAKYEGPDGPGSLAGTEASAIAEFPVTDAEYREFVIEWRRSHPNSNVDLDEVEAQRHFGPRFARKSYRPAVKGMFPRGKPKKHDQPATD